MVWQVDVAPAPISDDPVGQLYPEIVALCKMDSLQLEPTSENPAKQE
jgi:hypothetical protein